jgi:hypothetical protein
MVCGEGDSIATRRAAVARTFSNQDERRPTCKGTDSQRWIQSTLRIRGRIGAQLVRRVDLDSQRDSSVDNVAGAFAFAESPAGLYIDRASAAQQDDNLTWAEHVVLLTHMGRCRRGWRALWLGTRLTPRRAHRDPQEVGRCAECGTSKHYSRRMRAAGGWGQNR